MTTPPIRWRISKALPGEYFNKPWDAYQPGERATPHATWAEALAYVNDQLAAPHEDLQ